MRYRMTQQNVPTDLHCTSMLLKGWHCATTLHLQSSMCHWNACNQWRYRPLTYSLTHLLTYSLTFQAVSRTFSGAPKKMLGYFYESLLLERERNTRELLIHMCSFGGSQSPFASAECLKSMVNTQFQVEDAVWQLTHSLTHSLTYSLIGACLHKYFNINCGFTYFFVC